ncbi:hypothetical protein RFM23_24490 [Mesorhizobium abyssinicae]|uniref:Uncharacterized protein n=1 Tax=Mesorhizobium abyssinicae TaxID=1209958 RepID=A0ABU5ATY6_9HYPH|nr:hypothetical protein [Mesorhizobium abyssinicae]MDX8540778.1 hypothetical protein [Mesorhizobium abyssinicae]
MAGDFKLIPREGSWLGTGFYLFYRAPGRAAEWAGRVTQRRSRGTPGITAAVIECEVDLANTINLLDSADGHWDALKRLAANTMSTPRQLGPQAMVADPSNPKLYRNVDDNDLVNAYVQILRRQRPVASIMAAFIEGTPVFSTSWLYDHSHLCISVLEKDAIRKRKLIVP